jgi:hypothetical protein
MEESGDDFLPLKELAKKLVVEPTVPEKRAETPVKKSEYKPRIETGSVKTMSPENLSDLRSALAAVMKKTESNPAPKPAVPKVEVKSEPQVKREESKPVPKIEPHEKSADLVASKKEVKEEPKKAEQQKEKNDETREISEDELKKILGI